MELKIDNESDINLRLFKKLREKWYDYLMFISCTPRNRELSSDYFFEQFATHPKYFYHFVLFLKRKIQKTKDDQLKIDISNKYLNIISIFCERFGFFEEKNFLDELCFSISHPKEFSKIYKPLSIYKTESKKYIEQVLHKLKNLLEST